MVYEIISKLRTINDTDFHLFFTKMSFINHCLPDESISAGEKVCPALFHFIRSFWGAVLPTSRNF